MKIKFMMTSPVRKALLFQSVKQSSGSSAAEVLNHVSRYHMTIVVVVDIQIFWLKLIL